MKEKAKVTSAFWQLRFLTGSLQLHNSFSSAQHFLHSFPKQVLFANSTVSFSRLSDKDREQARLWTCHVHLGWDSPPASVGFYKSEAFCIAPSRFLDRNGGREILKFKRMPFLWQTYRRGWISPRISENNLMYIGHTHECTSWTAFLTPRILRVLNHSKESNELS